jgi:hypothetical protein
VQFPELLRRMQRGDKTPRRWLLLGREKGIPSEDGAGRLG